MFSEDDIRNGLKTRTEITGKPATDRTMHNQTPFTAPLQDMINAHCWNDIWNRPGLDRRTRSLITLALLTAQGATEELKAHVTGALNNDCSEQEIQEVLLQATAYCGFAAGSQAFRAASEALQPAPAESLKPKSY